MHGDRQVTLFVAGGQTDHVSFTIDLRAPSVRLFRADEWVLPTELELGALFWATDRDEAEGDNAFIR